MKERVVLLLEERSGGLLVGASDGVERVWE
jgi:hypothetical protein